MSEEMTFDASQLGLPPGHWPETLTIGARTYLRASRKRDQEGETVFVRYVLNGAQDVLVFND